MRLRQEPFRQVAARTVTRASQENKPVGLAHLAGFALVGPVHPGDCLQKRVIAHRLVEVHRVEDGRVVSGPGCRRCWRAAGGVADQRARSLGIFRVEPADLSVEQILEVRRSPPPALPPWPCRGQSPGPSPPHPAARRSSRSPARRRGYGPGRSCARRGWTWSILQRGDEQHVPFFFALLRQLPLDPCMRPPRHQWAVRPHGGDQL